MVALRRVLLVSGSLRARSTNTAVLRTAQVVAPDNVRVVIYEGLGHLPHFNPDEDSNPLPPPVTELREAVHSADAIVFSVPEYAGALPGSFKNLLDWTIGDDQPRSIAGKPTAWINASPRGAVHAHDSLRRVLGYAKATIIESACAQVPVTGTMIGADGLIEDPAIREQVRAVVTILARYRDRADSTDATGIS
jgi:chromate reductase, NAD(P)H dehydrogenase (quinone)